MLDVVLEFVNAIFTENDLPFALIVLMLLMGEIYFCQCKYIPNILKRFILFVGAGLVVLIIAIHWFESKFYLVLTALIFIAVGVIGMIARKIRVSYFFEKIEKLCDGRSINRNYVAAWNILKDFSKSIFTDRELKKYDRYRIFLCIQMGNIKGAKLLLEDIKSEIDRLTEEGNSPKNQMAKDELSAYYHNCMQLICIHSGDLKTAAEESIKAYDSLSKDTSFDIAIQVYINRGVNSVYEENYIDADDHFRQALKYYDKHRKKKSDNITRANLFYNYCYNKTRLIKSDDSEWHRVLDEYKLGMDKSNIQDLVSAYNIELQLLHQTNADTEQIARLVSESFKVIIDNKYLQKHVINRCILEASQARIVWFDRLNPTNCILHIYKDLDQFEKLPMPDRYICFKDINIMMQEWKQTGSVECDVIRERAFSYMKYRAEEDLNNYRESLPNEAVLQRAFCLAELAGVHKIAHVDDYNFELVKQYLDNAIGLLGSNDLLIDVCERKLCLVDEMGGMPNFTPVIGFKYHSEMSAIMDEVEPYILQLRGHPIVAQFALRIAFYSVQTNEFDRMLKYYRIYKQTKFDIHNLPPWCGRYYMVVCIMVRAKMFADTIDDIRKSPDVKTLSKDCRDWFESYPHHDGVLESLLLGRFLGFEHGITLGQKLYFAGDSNPGNIKCHSWLVFPELGMEFDMLYMQTIGKGNGNLLLSNLGQHPMGTDKAPLLYENFMNIQMRIVANTILIDPDLQEPALQKIFTSLYSIICNKIPQDCPPIETIKTAFVQTVFPVKPMGI